MKYFILLIILFIHLTVFGERKGVLIFHSYHSGLEWTDNINQGIHRAFIPTKDSVELFFEYLDRKRNLGEDYYAQLEELYKNKIRNIQYDVIVACDNDALNFVIKHRNDHFRDIPIVFCGINNFNEQMLQGQENITGIEENPDFEATLSLISKFHPQVSELYIINDDKTTTAKENKKLLVSIEQEFKGKLAFHYWENYSAQEIRFKLRQLKNNSAVLLATYNKDDQGNFISYKQNREFIPEDYSIPVYCPWDFFMGGAVIGGKIISGEDQGYRAGVITVRILRGEEADQIPIVQSSLSKYTFSYPMLKKFQIKESDLPSSSIILNKPQSFYTINKQIIFLVIAILFASVFIIFILSNAIIRTLRAEKLLIEKQEVLQKKYLFEKMNARIVSLLNSTNDISLVINGILQEISVNYSLAKVTLFSLSGHKTVKKVIGCATSEQGQHIRTLQENEFHYLDNFIRIIEREDLFITTNLANLTNEERLFFENCQIETFALFPIRFEKDMFGMVALANDKYYSWDENKIEEILTLMRLISNAWERNVQMNKRLVAEQQNVKATQMIAQASRLASIGVMASGITHEINQPLNALRITVDGLRFWDRRNTGNLPGIVKNKIETLSRGVDRIDQIIKHMRNFWVAPYEADVREQIDLNKAVINAYSLIERQIKDQGIGCELSIPEEVVWVHANFIQIEQIIVNLAINAFQAFENKDEANKMIKIAIQNNQNSATIIVEDNASGIDPSVGDKIYDPFYSTKKEGEGTGFGLALVKTFVDKVNGEIYYRNNQEGGVSFFISLFKS
jgi:C4-dicarboxylate-specific signal transduction histidine kinase/ABC-type uncharacterized transport system substrate-binding protein